MARRYDGRHSRFPGYVPVAARRAKADAETKRLTKSGRTPSPVRIEGRTIAKTFWGKAWCHNLEVYSDYENRLPRGRTYVRNGSVLDLQLGTGTINAVVSGSRLYKVAVAVTPVAPELWRRLAADCSGSIGSLIELLAGRLSDAVMTRLCKPGDGLFPSPRELRFTCSCPDSASLCKHIAAVLYGVGARLDASPQLLFQLRHVQADDLIASAATNASLSASTASSRVLDGDDDLSALFGIDLGEELPAPRLAAPAAAAAAVPKSAARSPAVKTPVVPDVRVRKRAVTTPTLPTPTLPTPTLPTPTVRAPAAVSPAPTPRTPPARATPPLVAPVSDPADGITITASVLLDMGIPRSTFQNWVARRELIPTGVRGEYRLTPTALDRIGELLGC